MSPTLAPQRALAVAFALCALVTLALLASHPAPTGPALADFIRSESRHQLIDALVHGGLIVTLGVLLVCFARLAHALGAARFPVLVGLVAFSLGCGALMLSMLLDGLVVPALASRFAVVDDADELKAAGHLFVLCGTLIRFLLRAGLLFQAAALLGWSLAVGGTGLWRFAVGACAIAVAAVLIVALTTAPPLLAGHLLLGGILLQSAWYVALAGLLWGGSAASS